jgi:hypothetical protein
MNYLSNNIWVINVLFILFLFFPFYVLYNKAKYRKTYEKINNFVNKVTNISENLSLKKHLTELNFKFNYANRENVLVNYNADLQILENFKNQVIKKIYFQTIPEPTIIQIQHFFSNIFEQYKFLYLGLFDFFPNMFNRNPTENLSEFIKSQLIWMTDSLEINPYKKYSNEIFESIEEILVNNNIVGLNCLINILIEEINNEAVEKEKIFDWLAQNKNAFININPQNNNLIAYYDHLQNYVKTKIEIDSKKGDLKIFVQNNNLLNHTKNKNKTVNKTVYKSSSEKITSPKKEPKFIPPTRLNDIMIGITEEKYLKIIEKYFNLERDIYRGLKISTKENPNIYLQKITLKFFLDKLYNDNFFDKTIFDKCKNTDRAILLTNFLKIDMRTDDFSKRLDDRELEKKILNYIDQMNLQKSK